MYTFNIFGSHDSQDIDLMVFLDELPNIQKCKELCKKLEKDLIPEIPDYDGRPLNVNLGVLKTVPKSSTDDNIFYSRQRGDVIDKVFKGYPCETNNSILSTYNLHDNQAHPMMVDNHVTNHDWMQIKAARVLRVMLSFISRTQYRKGVKAALKGNTELKMNTLMNIDFNTIEDFGKPQVKKDIMKGFAFQMGQSMAHFIDEEYFTKEDIGYAFEELKPFLDRSDKANLYDLNIIKNYYLLKLRTEFPDVNEIVEC